MIKKNLEEKNSKHWSQKRPKRKKNVFTVRIRFAWDLPSLELVPCIMWLHFEVCLCAMDEEMHLPGGSLKANLIEAIFSWGGVL